MDYTNDYLKKMFQRIAFNIKTEESRNAKSADNTKMHILRQLEYQDDGVSLKELSAQLKMPQSTTRQMVTQLQRSGFVEKAMHPTDGRSFLVKLTDKGRNYLDDILHKGSLDPFVNFTEEEKKTFVNLLRKMDDTCLK